MAPTERSSFTVSYDSESHISVLTQMWGSKWPEVLPYCLANVFFLVFLTIVDRLPGDTRVNITNQGHSFIALVVAFLLVSRVRIALNRYNHVRECLGTLYRETSELVQNACVLSETPKNTSSPEAQQWRHELAYRALILLRTCMAVIDYPVTRTPAWAIPQLNGNEMIDVEQNTFVHRYAHTSRAENEESLRVPIRLAYLLRKTLNSHKKRLEDPLPVAHVGKVMANIDTIMNGYYGVRQFMTTPVPFPLIQMARTFLFLYVFTVPFVLIGDESSLLSHCFMVFVMTYGFVGLELVAIEMDNPFGDDANDFDNNAMAEVAYEDVYLTVLDIDGIQWADKLRSRMRDGRRDMRTDQVWIQTGIPS